MPRLLSVNVGLPREVTWNGKTVRTAVWKFPVAGRRMVRKLNIDGDAQADLAGHGGEHRAVFVYRMDSYHYWERFLGRSDFSSGQFGEDPVRGNRRTTGPSCVSGLEDLQVPFRRLADREQEDGTLVLRVRRKESDHIIIEER